MKIEEYIIDADTLKALGVRLTKLRKGLRATALE